MTSIVSLKELISKLELFIPLFKQAYDDQIIIYIQSLAFKIANEYQGLKIPSDYTLKHLLEYSSKYSYLNTLLIKLDEQLLPTMDYSNQLLSDSYTKKILHMVQDIKRLITNIHHDTFDLTKYNPHDILELYHQIKYNVHNKEDNRNNQTQYSADLLLVQAAKQFQSKLFIQSINHIALNGRFVNLIYNIHHEQYIELSRNNLKSIPRICKVNKKAIYYIQYQSTMVYSELKSNYPFSGLSVEIHNKTSNYELTLNDNKDYKATLYSYNGKDITKEIKTWQRHPTVYMNKDIQQFVNVSHNLLIVDNGISIKQIEIPTDNFIMMIFGQSINDINKEIEYPIKEREYIPSQSHKPIAHIRQLIINKLVKIFNKKRVITDLDINKIVSDELRNAFQEYKEYSTTLIHESTMSMLSDMEIRIQRINRDFTKGYNKNMNEKEVTNLLHEVLSTVLNERDSIYHIIEEKIKLYTDLGLV